MKSDRVRLAHHYSDCFTDLKDIDALAGWNSATFAEHNLRGEGGIRTHGTVSCTHALQACQFSHSCTSPRRINLMLGSEVSKITKNFTESESEG